MTTTQPRSDMSTQDTTNIKEPQDFLVFLNGINRGRSVIELTTALTKLVESVQQTGRAGKLSYTVDIKPVSKGAKNPHAPVAVTVTDQLTVKTPRLDRPESVFFVDDNNHLVRDHPQQHALPINTH